MIDMGLSYAPQYTWTEHFVQRAQERFEVNADSLQIVPEPVVQNVLSMYTVVHKKVPSLSSAH